MKKKETQDNKTKGNKKTETLGKVVHLPHDKQLFNALKDKDVAKDVCLAYLPQDVIERVDLSKMVLYSTKKVSPQHRAFEGDIFYLLPLTNNQKAFVVFHMEHTSTPDKTLPLRIWQYLLLVLLEYMQNHPNEDLPLVFPLILYTGQEPYHCSTDLLELFGENKELMRERILQAIKLVDVCRLSDDAIKQHRLFGLTEFVYKQRFFMQFKPLLEALFPLMKLYIENEAASPEYLRDVLKYVMETVPDSDPQVFEQTVKEYFTNEMGEEIMTAAQQLRQEGMQQGMQQGMQEGMQQGMQFRAKEIAKKMLSLGEKEYKIAEYTGLSIHEIQTIKAEL